MLLPPGITEEVFVVPCETTPDYGVPVHIRVTLENGIVRDTTGYCIGKVPDISHDSDDWHRRRSWMYLDAWNNVWLLANDFGFPVTGIRWAAMKGEPELIVYQEPGSSGRDAAIQRAENFKVLGFRVRVAIQSGR